MKTKPYDPGMWWNAPPELRFRAYYECLRVHYEMSALEAFKMAKHNFAEFSTFFNDPVTAMRQAIRDGKRA